MPRGHNRRRMRRAPFTVATLIAAHLSLGQVPSAQEDLTAATRERIATLNAEFRIIGDAAQARLDAANCRLGCPDTGSALQVQTRSARDAVTAKVHAEVDAFIRRTAVPRPFNVDRIALGLRQTLPPGEPSTVIRGRSAKTTGHFIAAYVVYKGDVMGPGATSVMLRAYIRTARGVALRDVTGSDMDGYGRLSILEIRPRLSSPPEPVAETFVLLSGYMTGANGPNNRMRLYAYDGTRFRPVWMPANEWGNFDVKMVEGGFTVVGPYYRENRRRNERYVVSDDGLIKYQLR